MKTFRCWDWFSLGGLKVLVLYLQERFGWRAGRIQMAFDCVIVLTAFALVDWQQVALSITGAVVLSRTLATDQNAGWYQTLKD